MRRLRAGRQPRIRGTGGLIITIGRLEEDLEDNILKPKTHFYLVVVVRRAEEGRSRGDKVVGSGW